MDLSVLSMAATVRSFEVDFSQHITVEALLRYMQEAAWMHAEELGVGYSHLFRENRVWVLSRLTLKINKLPRWNQSIRVNTWARGVDSLFALRDFEVVNETNDICSAATTSWVVVDTVRRRPVKVEPIIRPIPIYARRALTCDACKLTETEITDAISQVRAVQYSDVDLNGHVNNTKYVGWLMDSMPFSFHRGHECEQLDINYLAEVKDTESVKIISSNPDGYQTRHTIQSTQTQSDVCRADIRWRVRKLA